MKKIITLFLLFLILTASHSAFAKEKTALVDEETKKICNKLISNIYYDIIDMKDRYKELANFDERAMYENKLGIYTIMYKHDNKQPSSKSKRKVVANFGVTIDHIESPTFKSQPGSFDFGFSALNLKISGYQRKHILRSQFDIMPLIEKYGKMLMHHQQKYLSLKLSMRTLRDVYRVQEDIEFEVTLANVSKRHMRVKSLGFETLYFLFDNNYWGTKPSSSGTGGKKVILKSGESISMRFKGESFQRPRDFEIHGIYRMIVDGVNPSGVLKVKVVE